MFSRRLILTLLTTATVLFAACDSGDWREDLPDPIDRDLQAILDSDTLRVLTTYNSTSYFLYRGQPMGYEYELLRSFAEEQDLEIKMEVRSTRDSIYHRLNTGLGDIVADRVVPQAADSAYIAFTKPLYETRPVLVQREPVPEDSVLPQSVDTVLQDAIEDPSRPIDELAIGTTADPASPLDPKGPDSSEVRARLVRRPADLSGAEVLLPYRSEYVDMLIEVADTITGDVHVVELDTVGSYEEVIRFVSSGIVEFTVSPRNLARLKQGYFTNIHIRPAIGPEHEVAWAIRRNATALQEALNAWIAEQKGSGLFEQTYNKYFVDRRGYNQRVESQYLTGETGTLSDYDALFRTYADTVGWDWRLLASQAYQESRFEPLARSWAGAAGLLQLMPPTAREFGVTNVYDPEDNVAGAARFILWLQDYWEDKIQDEQERLKFVLASYNTGHGHVEDARRLAEKNGDSTTEWADVAYWLLQKSKREVYTDPVVRYGYSRGLEPVTYVSYILDRFDHYREFVDVAEDQLAADTAETPESTNETPRVPSFQ